MKNLAIFYGGKSAEHDISIITAISVIKNLDKKKYKIFPVYITKNQDWCLVEDATNLYKYATDNLKGKRMLCGFFEKCLVKKTKFGFKKIEKIDVCINCMHGLNGEDGTLSGLLEMADLAYVGSGVLASSIGMDKVVQKDLFIKNQIPCAKYVCTNELKLKETYEQEIEKIEKEINYPIIVKPANLGSSIGINISKNREELQKNIEIALNFDKKLILEEVIDNLREINCSVIGNYKSVEISVLEEPKNWETFLDFNEKYLTENIDGNKKQVDISLGEKLDKQIKNYSEKVFKLLGASGVVRIDFLLNDKTKKVYVNEINTIPGSYANYLWKHKYTFGALLDKLIEYAEEEYIYKNKNKYTFTSEVLNTYSKLQNSNKIKFEK